MKKSHNPFKILESWVGSLIFPLMLLNNNFTAPFITNIFSPILNSLFIPLNIANSGLIEFFLLAILGFLLGWGIHSFFRYFRRRK